MPSLGLHIISITALLLGVASSAVTVTDLVLHPQKMWIMNLVWPLTALYLGPFALWFYYSSGRNVPGVAGGPRPSPWREVLKGSMHCGAGCAMGDFAAEWVVFLSGIRILGSDLLTKYVFAFVLAFCLGIFFQYFTIAPMRKLSAGRGLVAALKADTLSLVAFEVGMFACMAFARYRLPGLTPVMAGYWFMMQLAMILGLATTYPVSGWLIRKGWKEPM